MWVLSGSYDLANDQSKLPIKQPLLNTITTIYHLLGSLLAVHEPLRVDAGREDLVALTEFLEEDAVGETETADTDPLQHSVAA